MKEKILNQNNITIFSGALIITLITSLAIWSPIRANIRIEKELGENCANLKIDKSLERDIDIDIENSSFELLIDSTQEFKEKDNIDQENNFPNNKESVSSHENTIIKLPLISKQKPRNNIMEKCNNEAKEIIKEVQEIYDEYISQNCKDFKDIVSGKKQTVIKNGRKVNIQGAKDFIEKFCS